MELDEVADALYAAPVDDFVRQRDAAAREAQQAGDRVLAGAIGKLRRPTVGAWLANLLSHRHPAEVGRLVALGEGMREAQDSLDVAALRAYGKERQQVVAELVRLARADAAELGQPAGGAAVAELESTLTAAVADADASAALVGGRLLKGLSYSGFGTVAGGVSTATPRSQPPSKASTRVPAKASAKTPAEANGKAAQVDEAERDLAQARLQGAAAEAAAERAADEVARLQQAVDAAGGRLDELRAQLAAAEDEHAGLGEELRSATEDSKAAADAVAETLAAIADAEQELGRLLS